MCAQAIREPPVRGKTDRHPAGGSYPEMGAAVVATKKKPLATALQGLGIMIESPTRWFMDSRIRRFRHRGVRTRLHFHRTGFHRWWLGR